MDPPAASSVPSGDRARAWIAPFAPVSISPRKTRSLRPWARLQIRITLSSPALNRHLPLAVKTTLRMVAKCPPVSNMKCTGLALVVSPSAPGTAAPSAWDLAAIAVAVQASNAPPPMPPNVARATSGPSGRMPGVGAAGMAAFTDVTAAPDPPPPDPLPGPLAAGLDQPGPPPPPAAVTGLTADPVVGRRGYKIGVSPSSPPPMPAGCGRGS